MEWYRVFPGSLSGCRAAVVSARAGWEGKRTLCSNQWAWTPHVRHRLGLRGIAFESWKRVFLGTQDFCVSLPTKPESALCLWKPAAAGPEALSSLSERGELTEWRSWRVGWVGPECDQHVWRALQGRQRAECVRNSLPNRTVWWTPTLLQRGTAFLLFKDDTGFLICLAVVAPSFPVLFQCYFLRTSTQQFLPLPGHLQRLLDYT
jgi:hypothetical protein